MNKALGSLLGAGVVGLTILFALNLFAAFGLKQPDAQFFTAGWEQDWSAMYFVWGGMIVAGLLCAVFALARRG